MKEEKRKQLNNRGFSLVELLVTMAVSGVIAILVGGLILNGSKWYAGETAKADMQNDIQTINTKLQKTLMEATSLTIKEENGVKYILTGELDGAGSWTADSNPHGTARAVIVYKNFLYITDQYYSPDDVVNNKVPKGYQYTSYLSEGTYQANVKNAVTDDKTDSPLVVEVAYGMKKNKKTSKTKYEVTLRNSASMDEIHLNGAAVTVQKD